jgi:hypothetical protein
VKRKDHDDVIKSIRAVIWGSKIDNFQHSYITAILNAISLRNGVSFKSMMAEFGWESFVLCVTKEGKMDLSIFHTVEKDDQDHT